MEEEKTRALLAKVRSTLREQGLLETGTRILAAVSGGADSLCLLFLLDTLAKTEPICLRALHVNHGIRASAENDAALVDAFCKERGIPCRIVRVDVPGYAARRHLGTEEAARILRYEALEEEAAAWGKEKPGLPVRIALAHHLEDQAETVLFHLARGSGIAGLSGMRVVSGQKIRPLLDVSREEIEGVLREQAIVWAEDETNRDPSYARNRIRLVLLPEMEKTINAGTGRHLAALAKEAAEVEDYLEEETEKALQRVLRPDGGIFLPLLWKEAPLLQRRLLYRYLTKKAGRKKDITREHIQRLLDLARGSGSGRMDLPYGLQGVRRYDVLYLLRQEESLPKGDLPLPEREEDYEIRVFPFSGQLSDIPQKKYTKWFDYDKISPAFSFRTRRPGDVITIAQAQRSEDGSVLPAQTKSIKKFMIDVRIPADLRDRILLPACGSQILWVPGYRMGAEYKVTETTRRILELRLTGGEDGGDDHHADFTGQG
ncbi:MAG: tRNA lysidine(34) synthetase TilS [Lachnospiraceae bacterium]